MRYAARHLVSAKTYIGVGRGGGGGGGGGGGQGWGGGGAAKSERRNESKLPDRVSNPGPLTYKSGALSIALCATRHGTWLVLKHT